MGGRFRLVQGTLPSCLWTPLCCFEAVPWACLVARRSSACLHGATEQRLRHVHESSVLSRNSVKVLKFLFSHPEALRHCPAGRAVAAGRPDVLPRDAVLGVRGVQALARAERGRQPQGPHGHGLLRGRRHDRLRGGVRRGAHRFLQVAGPSADHPVAGGPEIQTCVAAATPIYDWDCAAETILM